MIVKLNNTSVVYSAVNGIINNNQSFQPASQKYEQAVVKTFLQVSAGGRSSTTWLKTAAQILYKRLQRKAAVTSSPPFTFGTHRCGDTEIQRPQPQEHRYWNYGFSPFFFFFFLYIQKILHLQMALRCETLQLKGTISKACTQFIEGDVKMGHGPDYKRAIQHSQKWSLLLLFCEPIRCLNVQFETPLTEAADKGAGHQSHACDG